MPKRNRPFIALECTKCKNRNYTTSRNPKTTERLELTKWCKHDREVVAHKETK